MQRHIGHVCESRREHPEMGSDDREPSRGAVCFRLPTQKPVTFHSQNHWFLHPFTGLPRDNASGRDTTLRRGARGIVHAKHQSIISFNKLASARRHTHSLWSSFSPLAVQVAMALKNFAAMWTIFCAVCPLIPGNERKPNPVNMEKSHHLHVAEGETLDGVVALLYSERVRRMDFNAQ